MRVGACNWVCLIGLWSCVSACSEQPLEREQVGRVTAAVGLIPSSLLNGFGPIPSNGGLLIDAHQGQLEVTVQVADGSASPIAGTLHERLGHWVWMADTPMPEGSYAVLIATQTFSNQPSQLIEVTSARNPAKPALTSDPIAGSEVAGEVEACCSAPTPLGETLQSCFLVASQRYVTLSPGLLSADSPSAMTQLLFRVTPSSADSVADPSLFWDAYSLHFTEQADEYCFDLEAFEITTGERYTFEELDRCAPHGELPAPARMSHDVPDSALDRTVCTVPPGGYEERWCELNEAECVPGQILAGCGYVGELCRGEPAPAGGSSGAGAGGAASTAGEAGAAGSPGDGDGEDDEPQMQATHVTACACNIERARSASPASLLAMAGLIAGVMLRRLRRARRPVSRPS
jgi:hypothetical protein